MPNWCSTKYAIEGPKEEIKNLYDKIQEWTSKEYKKSDFGLNWLGNIVLGAGLDYNKTPCRGTLTYAETVDGYEEDNLTLSMETETAWTDCTTMWEQIVKKYAPHSSIYYQAEEPGCEYYVTNDADGRYYPEKYIIRTYVDDEKAPKTELEKAILKAFPEEETSYYDKDDLENELREVFHDKESTLSKLIAKLESVNTESENLHIYINEYEQIDDAA